MPPYRVLFRQVAQKEFDHLSDGQRKAAQTPIDLLESDATPPGAELVAGFDTLWKIKGRDVAVVYEAPDARGDIYIIKVGFSPEVYEDLGSRLN